MDLAAQAHRKITSAPDGLLLTLPVAEPVVEFTLAVDEAGFEDKTIEAIDAQQPNPMVKSLKPRTTRGDIHSSMPRSSSASTQRSHQSSSSGPRKVKF
jgi:hypothetical protein